VCVGGSQIGCLKHLSGGSSWIWGAATLPTLSTLSRINDDECAGLYYMRA